MTDLLSQMFPEPQLREQVVSEIKKAYMRVISTHGHSVLFNDEGAGELIT